jgi:hypothetical protein
MKKTTPTKKAAKKTKPKTKPPKPQPAPIAAVPEAPPQKSYNQFKETHKLSKVPAPRYLWVVSPDYSVMKYETAFVQAQVMRGNDIPGERFYDQKQATQFAAHAKKQKLRIQTMTDVRNERMDELTREVGA